MLKVICISPEPIPACSGRDGAHTGGVAGRQEIPTPAPMSASGMTICCDRGLRVEVPIQHRATACIARATVIGMPGPIASTHRPATGSNTMHVPVVMTMTQLAVDAATCQARR